jgi:hypothetical protein
VQQSDYADRHSAFRLMYREVCRWPFPITGARFDVDLPANGLARSNLQGGISKEGVRRVPRRAFNQYITCLRSNEEMLDDAPPNVSVVDRCWISTGFMARDWHVGARLRSRR